MNVGVLPPISAQKPGATPVIKSQDIIRESSIGSTLHNPFVNECVTFLDDSNMKIKRIVNPGDIFMFVQGGINNVGKCFVYQGKEPCVLGSNLALLIFKDDTHPRYLMHMLNLPRIKNQIHRIALKKNTSWELAGITFEDIKDIEIPIPASIGVIPDNMVPQVEELLKGVIKLKNTLNKLLEMRKKQYEDTKEKLLTENIPEEFKQ